METHPEDVADVFELAVDAETWRVSADAPLTIDAEAEAPITIGPFDPGPEHVVTDITCLESRTGIRPRTTERVVDGVTVPPVMVIDVEAGLVTFSEVDEPLTCIFEVSESDLASAVTVIFEAEDPEPRTEFRLAITGSDFTPVHSLEPGPPGRRFIVAPDRPFVMQPLEPPAPYAFEGLGCVDDLGHSVAVMDAFRNVEITADNITARTAVDAPPGGAATCTYHLSRGPVPPGSATSTIAGRVFGDRDRDGVRDDAEIGLFGVTVEAWDASGPLDSATTDDAGGYALEVPADSVDVRVCVVLTEGTELTFPSGKAICLEHGDAYGPVGHLIRAADDDIDELDFGLREAASVGSKDDPESRPLPRPGTWKVQNKPGAVKCSRGLSIPIAGTQSERGSIKLRNGGPEFVGTGIDDGDSRIVFKPHKKKRDRWTGSYKTRVEGVDFTMVVILDLVNRKRLKGRMSAELNVAGQKCTISRAVVATFVK